MQSKLKILVSGANGYIGRHVVEQLSKIGHEIIACDIRVEKLLKNVKYIESNIFSCNYENLFQELGSPDVCLHMAWRDGFVHNSNNHILDLSSHFRFIQAMVDGGVKRIAVMGTMHEVGYWEGAIDDNTPCNPISLYGIAKDALRRATIIYCKLKQCKLQWLRAFYILGDDKRNNSIFSKLLQAAESGLTNFPFTTGKTQYDFISVDDLSFQIACAISQEDILGIINCCSGKPISLADRVEQFIKDKKLNIKLEYGVYPDRPYDSPIIYGDASKINQIVESKINVNKF